MNLDLAEALLLVGELRREEIPALAADLLENGTDTPTIRRLAGLIATDLSEAHDLFRRVLEELGRQPPTLNEAAQTIARHLAESVLADTRDLRFIAARGARLAIAFGYHAALMPSTRRMRSMTLAKCGPLSKSTENWFNARAHCLGGTLSNITLERTACSHSLAAAAHREREAAERP